MRRNPFLPPRAPREFSLGMDNFGGLEFRAPSKAFAFEGLVWGLGLEFKAFRASGPSGLHGLIGARV